jgi:hypothetical protein
MSDIEVLSRTQKINVEPPSSIRGIEVLSRTQRIIVESPSSVSVVNAGPIGPGGPQGIQGIPGVPGASGATGAGTYVHNQDTPGSLWIIFHAMSSYPSIEIVDSAGSTVQGDVSYPSDQEVRVQFSAAFSGQAFLN